MHPRTKFFPIRCLPSLVICLFWLAAGLTRAETQIPAGDIGTTTWGEAGSPYVVPDDVRIPSGETLTIKPGVEVRFGQSAQLTINGRLVVEGTESKPILFTRSEPDSIFKWYGLKFLRGSGELDWCVIEGASTAMEVQNTTELEIRDSVFRHNSRGIQVRAFGYGCDVMTAKANITRCLFEGNQFGAVEFRAQGNSQVGCTIPKTATVDGLLSDCTIRDNRDWVDAGVIVHASHGYMSYGSATPVIQGCRIYRNNGVGIALSGKGDNRAEIRGNRIYENEESGIYSRESATISPSGIFAKVIVENEIYSNGASGIRNEDQRVIFRRNRITSNTTYGIETSHVRSFVRNELHDNGSYDFYYTDTEDQLVAHNDWGIADDLVDGCIYDRLDNASLGRVLYKWGKQLHFAQFGEGAGLLASRIILLNLDEEADANVRIQITDNQGGPLPVDLNGQMLNGELRTSLPSNSMRIFSTDGLGEVRVGSVKVSSDTPVAGVIEFGGNTGLAGVGASDVLDGDFIAPVEVNTPEGTNTGVALMNLESSSKSVTLELCDTEGQPLSTAQLDLPGLGHVARFTTEFDWSNPVDLKQFAGLLRARSDGGLAATVIHVRADELATMPVSPLQLLGSSESNRRLRFAQFGDGQGQLFSELILCNLEGQSEAKVDLNILDDAGDQITVDLNDVEVNGKLSLEIPPSGLQILKTDGVGPLVVGSVDVSSDQPLGGVVLFGGKIGVAGVGASPTFYNGFVAPVEVNSQAGVNSGIALMNLEDFWISSSILVELRDQQGKLLAQANVRLPPHGHSAFHIDELDWTPGNLDLSDFCGQLRVRSEIPIVGMVIRTSPGQFATMPAIPIP